jgi:hypothetical protein
MTSSIVAGETFSAQICAEAQSIVVYFRGPSSHDVDATGSGSEWKISTPTTGWNAGLYRWQAWATLADGSKKVLADYPLEIRPSIQDASEGTSYKSQTAQIVEKLEAMVAGGNVAQGVRKYRINNRELENYSVAELLDLLKYWRKRLVKENRIARGLSPNGPRIAVYC